MSTDPMIGPQPELTDEERAAIEEIGIQVLGTHADRERYFARKCLALTLDNKRLLAALEPFAKFACDEPHVDEPECDNCIARAAIAKAQET